MYDPKSDLMAALACTCRADVVAAVERARRPVEPAVAGRDAAPASGGRPPPGRRPARAAAAVAASRARRSAPPGHSSSPYSEEVPG